MRIPRILLPGPLSAGERSLDTDNSHYLGRVLRRQPGDPVLVCDGDGATWHARVRAVAAGSATLELLSASAEGGESPLRAHLGLALLRGDRMDYALQKACEMGVDSITLLHTERVEVRLNARRLDNRMRHFEGVLRHAMLQSGRSHLPRLHAPLPLTTWAAQQPAAEPRLVLDPEGMALAPIAPAPRRLSLVTGPEGGLSDSELSALSATGFQRVRLGPRVLRAETAPAATLAVLQWLFGDLGTA